ncbi:MAG TPA: sensor histidine kinase [Steroidobacteraceae bacterium]|nr:sensor histidine kinase [Steroidobacteraceae bacterium]HQW07732.1 sensor histidine kinase [Steroidobacteraceae bacterium]HQX46854.1 sensor histidine kinase [Steroidobacteraceae bacterium]HQX78597.1 sensor histidine kinase [Steroidobacteraceae bacterium]HQZ80472.1 sensor histidine kinase [Steroidobacteraceae bacterium]
MTEPAPPQRSHYLPDFCAGHMVLAIVLIVELTALVVTLARDASAVAFWTDLARTSLFLIWIGLAGQAALCLVRRRLETLPVGAGAAAVLGIVCGTVLLVSEVAYRIGASGLLSGGEMKSLFPREHFAFIGRNVAIAFIVTALALRYFFVTHEWRRNIEMQSRARVHALQARIRPHFLFNSMNTIAALTRSNPARAEEAVQDLADLFRASLAEKRDQITLAEEIEIARTYERIELLRLGGRLKVEWRIASVPQGAIVPSLMIQPLLENAIYHGIEPRSSGGTVTVTGEHANGLVTIVVRNPVPERAAPRDGNRVALANIRERLALMYGARAAVKAGRFDDEYIVTLRFPHEAENAHR